MSTVLSFNRKYLRHGANIQSRLTLYRQIRLCFTDMERPWANALDRLLAERRGLRKGALAQMANVRPGTISAVANSPKPPTVPTLQSIADALTAYDRRGNPTAPEVGLWEFFVTDEQAGTLRDVATATAEARRKAQPSTVADSLSQMQDALATLQQQLSALTENRRTG